MSSKKIKKKLCKLKDIPFFPFPGQQQKVLDEEMLVLLKNKMMLCINSCQWYIECHALKKMAES